MQLKISNTSRSLGLFGIVILVQFTACKKFLQIEPPPTLVQTEAVFSSESAAVSSVSGLYSQMIASNLTLTNGGSSVFPGLTSDELVNNFNPNYDPFRTNAIPRTNFFTANIWTDAYKNIYQANAILKGLAASTSISDSLKRQLTGEVYFVRGFYYFYLVNYFGAVPLVTGTSYERNAALPRAPEGEVYTQILTDVTRAAELLSDNYPSDGRVRPNRWAATALLARVYLYNKDWKRAEAAATSVITSGTYSLETDLNGVFKIPSNEAIWQLMRETNNTAEGTTFIPFSPDALPTMSLTPFLLNAFEAGDQRRANWLDSATVDGQNYFYPYKYKARGGGLVTEYLVVLRLAEQYLIRAEARVEQNNITGAQNDLNTIRNRAGIPNTTANTPTSLLAAIMHERQVELFAEWGHRWFDLKRTGLIDAVLGTEKSGAWKPTDALFPVPQDEIDRNGALTQNPGY